MTPTRLATRTRVAAIVLIAAGGLLGRGAAAQGLPSSGGIAGNGFQPPVKGGVVHPKTEPPPPPGIPGATRQKPIAPSAKAAVDMPPDEALFDAINRGDMGAAQDALSRGADLSAQNVLGMTPLDLSIDLNRNDITFLLLSLRNGSQPRPGTAPAVVAGVSGKNGKLPEPASAVRLAAKVRAVRPVQHAPAPGLAPSTIRYAGSQPGVPMPQAGFLGFGNP